MCQERMLNNLRIFRRSKHEVVQTGRWGFRHVCAFRIIYVPLNEHEHHQEDFFEERIWMLNLVSTGPWYTLLLWNRLFGEGTGSPCAADMLNRPRLIWMSRTFSSCAKKYTKSYITYMYSKGIIYMYSHIHTSILIHLIFVLCICILLEHRKDSTLSNDSSQLGRSLALPSKTMEVGWILCGSEWMHLKPWRSQLVLQRPQGVDQWAVGYLKAVDYTETWCEEKFCRSQDCKKWEAGRNLVAGLALLKVCGDVTSCFWDRFSLFLFGFEKASRESCWQHQRNRHSFQSLPPAVSKFQQEHQHEIPRNMAICCDEVAQKLLENTWPAVHMYEFFKSSCRNKPTCTCSGNSLRYGLLLDVAFRKPFALKTSYSLP